MSLQAWAAQGFALVHGEDPDRRKAAVAAWKAAHVDPEWADFSLTTCGEGCPWAEVLNALQEAPPFGTKRSVLVPYADNLLAKPKDLPPALKPWLENPPADMALLFVCGTTLPAGSGKPMGSKPWSEWAKQGRVLKVGALELAEVPAFLEAEAKAMGLKLGSGVAQSLASRLGGQPSLLKRALEVLDLLAEDRQTTPAMVDQVTFRLAEQRAFAWTSAFQKGAWGEALQALRQGLEDGDDPLQLLGQARREVERVVRAVEAEAKGVSTRDLPEALGLSPKQAFLVEGYRAVASKIRLPGAKALLAKVNQCERDLKGVALGRSDTPLTDLTLALSRAWAR
ncbi:MAG: DNA polymerase III subunit delta [Acidobacteria bacterium]|nr:DNA polymerase III subunit delta [Acidobacteriota bacterium]